MNKTLHLTALGNALVDLQYKISNDELLSLKLPKGEMRHITHEEQKKVIALLQSNNQFKSSGGSAANTIIAFSKFGGKSGYMTALGKDDFGEYYQSEFKELGIELHSIIVETVPTGVCLVLITPDSERTMLTALGASSHFLPQYVNEELISKSQWLYLEGYQLTNDDSANSCHLANEIAISSSVKTALTFSDVFVVEGYHKRIENIASKSEMIFCNEAEAFAFAGSDDIEKVQKIFNELSPNFVITMGSKGAAVKWKNELFKIPSFETKAVDTTGAGDMFAGAFLYGIIKSSNPEKSGNFASYASSLVISQFGARLNQDHSRLIEKFF